MTGTPGAAATRNGEAPERSPPCSPSYDLTGKVMLLGDSGVGKTCFLIQFKDGAFLSGTFIATVGIDFRNKVVTVDGMRVKLQIWDTAGQERFRSVTHAYYRDAQALLLLYDITNKSSFDNIRAWLTEIHEYAQRGVLIMLLGNKADVSSERVIRSEDGEMLARVNGENVEKETHQQVVSRIRAALNSVRLLVVDPETDERLQKLGVQVREEMLRPQEGSGPAEPPAAAEEQGAGGENEPPAAAPEPHEAEKSHQERVNGVCVEGRQHGDVVSAIKAGGDETKLLVVDKETDEFFRKCKVIPSQEHLYGPLPEPFTNGEIQKENSREALAETASESPRPTLARSTSSDTSEELNSQDSLKKQDCTAPSPTSSSSSSDPILDFNISLAVAKERAHQKRSSKRAPQMDWSKKNELFSNL
ncbi:Na(+)/H(+) exchange regulatory cofactor NHE-RF1, partial [Eschrichtius robustus]|nr:Na(+)/H(+) exchange regulatory cofactor NHE-RF1 [Eschrichtius robustus]